MARLGGVKARRLRAELRARREALGLNVRDAAKLVGVELKDRESLSYQALSKWENDKVQPRIDQLAAWARALGLWLDVALLDPADNTVRVELPPHVVPLARLLARLSPADLELVQDMAERLASRAP